MEIIKFLSHFKTLLNHLLILNEDVDFQDLIQFHILFHIHH